MKPVVTLFPSDAALEEVRALPDSPLSSDWYGQPATSALNYTLAVDSHYLYFRFQSSFKPLYDQTLQSAQFTEGLWKQDVAEIFLREDDGRRYQEINLAPSGAWWSALFTDYRAQSTRHFHRPHPALIECKVTDTGWTGLLVLSLEELSVDIEFSEQSALNVCAIVGTKPRHYFSASNLQAKQPDFHLVSQFETIELKKYES